MHHNRLSKHLSRTTSRSTIGTALVRKNGIVADTYDQLRKLSGNTQTVDDSRARLALSANAGQEMVNQTRHKVATTIDDARKMIAARIGGP